MVITNIVIKWLSTKTRKITIIFLKVTFFWKRFHTYNFTTTILNQIIDELLNGRSYTALKIELFCLIFIEPFKLHKYTTSVSDFTVEFDIVFTYFLTCFSMSIVRFIKPFSFIKATGNHSYYSHYRVRFFRALHSINVSLAVEKLMTLSLWSVIVSSPLASF